MNPSPLLQHFLLAETSYHISTFRKWKLFQPVQEVVEAVLQASSRADGSASKTWAVSLHLCCLEHCYRLQVRVLHLKQYARVDTVGLERETAVSHVQDWFRWIWQKIICFLSETWLSRGESKQFCIVTFSAVGSVLMLRSKLDLSVCTSDIWKLRSVVAILADSYNGREEANKYQTRSFWKWKSCVNFALRVG